MRSAHCAVLIALAAAAGIARIADERPTEDASSPMDGTRLSHIDSRLSAEVSQRYHALVSPDPTFRSWLVGALKWLGAITDTQPPTPGRAQPTHGPDSKAGFGALVGNHDSLSAPSVPMGQNHRAAARVPRTSERHLLPFAVGPPLAACHSHPIAKGTSVPGDVAANGIPVLTVALFDEDSSVTRPVRTHFTRRGGLKLRPNEVRRFCGSGPARETPPTRRWSSRRNPRSFS